MNRKRLTREDSRDQTKQRLLDAAEKLVAKKGLGATSVEDIAAAAGYTRGAFYSNFGGKHDLFIDLLRRDHEKALVEFNALLRDDVPIEEIKTKTRELYSTYCRNTDSFMSWTEARMLGTRDAKFRAKLNALLSDKRDQDRGVHRLLLSQDRHRAAFGDGDHGVGIHEPDRGRQALRALESNGHDGASRPVHSGLVHGLDH